MPNDKNSSNQPEEDPGSENSLEQANHGQKSDEGTEPDMDKVGEMVARIVSLSKEEHFKAPYPPPQYVELYNQASPGLGDKIMSEFFAESEFRRNETREQRQDTARAVRESNRIVLFLTLLFLACAAYGFYRDHPTAAVIMASVRLCVS